MMIEERTMDNDTLVRLLELLVKVAKEAEKTTISARNSIFIRNLLAHPTRMEAGKPLCHCRCYIVFIVTV